MRENTFNDNGWQDIQRECPLFVSLIEMRFEEERKRQENFDRDTKKAIAWGLLALIIFAK